MRNVLKTLFVVAIAVPAIASAAITNSRHDLSAASTTLGPKATTETQICKFCHAPHQAATQTLIWNKPAGAVNGFPAGQATVGGTALDTAFPAGSPSRACLSCHDGTVALGALSQGGGVTIAMSSQTVGAAYIVNFVTGNHPVSVPMPVVGGGAAYGNTTQGANVNAADFKASTTAVSLGVRLFGANANGVECGSCHDVHNGTPGNLYFLRVSEAGSAICFACHTK